MIKKNEMKKKKKKNGWVENLKGRLNPRKKWSTWDEFKTWSGGSKRNDSGWKVEMGDWKWEVEKWVRKILLTLSFYKAKGERKPR